MIIYAGIDGTSTEEETYKTTYYNSFINKLYRRELLQFSDTWYLRGPFLSGFDTINRSKSCYDWVINKWEKGEAKAIFLGGHSRGGAAVIEVAKWLKERNIPVECLILFDAVDRTHTLGGVFRDTPIPSNVKKVIHARRNIILTNSRLSFGNCGTNYESSATPRFQEFFFATHSGIGGVPWTKAVDPIGGVIPIPTIWEPGEVGPTRVTVSRDQSGSQQVWGWAKNHIAFAFEQCRKRLEQEKPNGKPDFQIPNQQPVGSLPPNGGGNGNQRIHIVQQGDWLSKIAIKYYGDAMKYKAIHQANLQVIGPNPDIIKPGQRLVIP